jgi:hypothetical protein
MFIGVFPFDKLGRQFAPFSKFIGEQLVLYFINVASHWSLLNTH